MPKHLNKGAQSHGEAVSEERVHMDNPSAETVIAQAIVQFGRSSASDADEILLLCVGTDRSIGDALGPLIGSQLAALADRPYGVLGTLENPVHASNLVTTVTALNGLGKQPFILAVDACLGRTESVGMLTVGVGSLRPGAGVNKSLPPVGHVYVTGIVNVGGFMEYYVLQNTRLSLVMQMARVAAGGIRKGLEALAGSSRRAVSGELS